MCLCEWDEKWPGRSGLVLRLLHGGKRLRGEVVFQFELFSCRQRAGEGLGAAMAVQKGRGEWQLLKISGARRCGRQEWGENNKRHEALETTELGAY